MNSQTSATSQGRPGMARELLQNASLAWRLLLDPQVAPLAKLVPAGVLAWILMPFNWIPVLGQLDDLVVILIGIRIFIALCPPARVRFHRGDLGEAVGSPPPSDNTIDGSYRIVDD